MIKYFVLNENILGYIIPTIPNDLQILHASVLKGATTDRLQGSLSISSLDKIRVAKLEDFIDFRVMLPPDFLTQGMELY